VSISLALLLFHFFRRLKPDGNELCLTEFNVIVLSTGLSHITNFSIGYQKTALISLPFGFSQRLD
jgi:hypothetical protein